MDICMLSRGQAMQLKDVLFKHNADNGRYLNAKSWTWYSVATLLNAGPNDVDFFMNAQTYLGNHDDVQKIGDKFAIITDVRLSFYEITGDLTNLAEAKAMLAGCHLDLTVANRPYIDDLPAWMFAKGGVGLYENGNGAGASTMIAPGDITQERRHCLIPYEPNQLIRARLSVNNAIFSTLTTDTKAVITLDGWKFEQVSQA